MTCLKPMRNGRMMGWKKSWKFLSRKYQVFPTIPLSSRWMKPCRTWSKASENTGCCRPLWSGQKKVGDTRWSPATDDEAIILMVDSNLQREKIMPSEKAFAYKMKLDAMKRQGARTDLTSSPVGMKSDGKQSLDKMGKELGESRNQIHRYIRLTELDSPILDMVDEGRIAFRPAVELSYLKPAEQKQLLEVMESEECTPSLTQSTKLKQFSKEGKLTNNVILSIMKEVKPNQKETIKIQKEKISKYFRKGTTDKKIEDTIIKALDLYQKRQKQMER
ncbi:hypothetical protein EUCA11A_41030 [Eubacterium callanderi]|nr:hypothetical protein EUCA2A_41030 [Eubacterium callanderi]WPK74211.1 hypothetical protein EUCA11A_41030 [Eubacterium callanderi]